MRRREFIGWLGAAAAACPTAATAQQPEQIRRTNEIIAAVVAIGEIRTVSPEPRIDVTDLINRYVSVRQQQQFLDQIAEVTGKVIYGIQSNGTRVILIEGKYLSDYSKNFRRKDELRIEYESVDEGRFRITRAALVNRVEK